MAYPQLSGKMVRLNGTNQYLTGVFPAVSWNALFLRLGFNPNNLPDSSYRTVLDWQLTGARLYVFMTCNANAFNIYTFFTTSAGTCYRLAAAFQGSHTLSTGPVELVIVWDGVHYANYLDGARILHESLAGTFSGGSTSFYIGSVTGLGNYFQGDIGHMILHNVIPAPYAGLPENVYDGELAATEYLAALGIPDPLVLYDWRASNGTNHGTGGAAYDLSAVNDPTFMAGDFQYKWVDETTPTIEYPRATVLGARLHAARLRARVKP
jgi:hypothetical protein